MAIIYVTELSAPSCAECSEPWFVGKDVAEALGYKDTVNALKRHIDEEDKLWWQFTTSGQRRGMTIINESGLYSLVLSSKQPFKHCHLVRDTDARP